MRVLVTGINGQLGHDVVKELNKRWDLMVIKRKAAGYEDKGC